MLTRTDLIAAVGETVPAWANTPARRVSYTLSVLAYGSVQDPEIKAAAKSCYDGSISRLGQRKATVGEIVDYVIARAMVAGLQTAETIPDEAWMPAPLPSVEELTARLDAAQQERIDRLDGTLPPLEDAPVIDETDAFVAWCATMTAEREAEQRRVAARQSRIRRHKLLERLRLAELEDWEDTDEVAAWDGYMSMEVA